MRQTYAGKIATAGYACSIVRGNFSGTLDQLICMRCAANSTPNRPVAWFSLGSKRTARAARGQLTTCCPRPAHHVPETYVLSMTGGQTLMSSKTSATIIQCRSLYQQGGDMVSRRRMA